MDTNPSKEDIWKIDTSLGEIDPKSLEYYNHFIERWKNESLKPVRVSTFPDGEINVEFQYSDMTINGYLHYIAGSAGMTSINEKNYEDYDSFFEILKNDIYFFSDLGQNTKKISSQVLKAEF